MDFIDHLGEMINLTKKECTLIEISTNMNGHQQFGLPATMRRDNDPNKSRRDSYTALLLGSWGVKCYFDMMRQPTVAQEFNFSPRMFR